MTNAARKICAILPALFVLTHCGNPGASANGQAAAETESRVDTEINALPTSLHGSTQGVLGNENNLSQIASQWSLAAADARTSVDSLKSSSFSEAALQPARAAAQSLADALDSVASCVRSMDPEIFMSSVGDKSGTLPTDAVNRLSQFNQDMDALAHPGSL